MIKGMLAAAILGALLFSGSILGQLGGSTKPTASASTATDELNAETAFRHRKALPNHWRSLVMNRR